jgi:hypothetical protein
VDTEEGISKAGTNREEDINKAATNPVEATNPVDEELTSTPTFTTNRASLTNKDKTKLYQRLAPNIYKFPLPDTLSGILWRPSEKVHAFTPCSIETNIAQYHVLYPLFICCPCDFQIVRA